MSWVSGGYLWEEGVVSVWEKGVMKGRGKVGGGGGGGGGGGIRKHGGWRDQIGRWLAAWLDLSSAKSKV